MSAFAFPVLADGALHPAGTPLVPAEDAAFQLGLGVFETLPVEQGHPVFLDAHLARLARGARTLGFDPPPGDALASAVRAYAEVLGARPGAPARYALRLTVSAGIPGSGRPAQLVIGRPLEEPPARVCVRIASLRVPADPLAAVKGTGRARYALARAEARRAGAYDALLLDGRGALAEASVANLFLVARGALHTPDLASGCLGGIVRAALLADLDRAPLTDERGDPLPLVVGRVDPELLGVASEVFLTNSTSRVLPVDEVQGFDRPGGALRGRHGPISSAVRARVDALERADRA